MLRSLVFLSLTFSISKPLGIFLIKRYGVSQYCITSVNYVFSHVIWYKQRQFMNTLVVQHHHLLLITQGHFCIIVNVFCFLTFKQSMQMEACVHDKKLLSVLRRLKYAVHYDLLSASCLICLVLMGILQKKM